MKKLFENWRKYVNESTSKETSDNFKKLAAAFGAVSDSLTSDAEQTNINQKEIDKFKELSDKFDKAGLDDFLEKIPNVEDLLDNIDDPKGASKFIKGLQDLGMNPQEIGEKIEQIQILRDEFDEYKKEQEESQKEREEAQKEKDLEQDKAMKDSSRDSTQDNIQTNVPTTGA